MKLTNVEKIAILGALVLIFAALGWYCGAGAKNFGSGVTKPVLTTAASQTPQEPTLVNINAAGPELLQTLDGIGEKTAEAIIHYREENGGFQTVEELINVPGIGEKKLEALLGSVTIN